MQNCLASPQLCYRAGNGEKKQLKEPKKSRILPLLLKGRTRTATLILSVVMIYKMGLRSSESVGVAVIVPVGFVGAMLSADRAIC